MIKIILILIFSVSIYTDSLSGLKDYGHDLTNPKKLNINIENIKDYKLNSETQKYYKQLLTVTSYINLNMNYNSTCVESKGSSIKLCFPEVDDFSHGVICSVEQGCGGGDNFCGYHCLTKDDCTFCLICKRSW